MNKKVTIILVIVAIVVIIGGVFVIRTMNKNTEENTNTGTNVVANNLENENLDDLSAVVEKVYSSLEEGLLPDLNTNVVDLEDADMVKMVTGLENGDNFEEVVFSEPLMSSQAYSFVLAKVKDGVDANNVAKEMSEKIDTRKWICVEADQLYATSSGNIVCLVMSDEERATAVYESAKEQLGNIEKEYERTAAPIELPKDMY